jgi:hypothetical protein
MTTQHTVTARRAAQLAGVNEKTIRRWIASGKLVATKIAANRFMIDPADLPPRKKNPVQDELERLRRDVDDLRHRVRTLESSKTFPALPRFDSEGVQSAQVKSYTPPVYKPPVDHSSASFFADIASNQHDMPDSIRGRARWVESHGGPPFTAVRDWQDVRTWSSVEDAIASVRRHRGYETWSPTP